MPIQIVASLGAEQSAPIAKNGAGAKRIETTPDARTASERQSQTTPTPDGKIIVPRPDDRSAGLEVNK